MPYITTLFYYITLHSCDVTWGNVAMYDVTSFNFTECQTELQQEWKTVEELQQRISVLEASLCANAQLDVKILDGNDKLTRLYTGLPTYDLFKALAEYLESKAVDMIAWNSGQTKELDTKGKQGGSCCFRSMSVANKLFLCLFA